MSVWRRQRRVAIQLRWDLAIGAFICRHGWQIRALPAVGLTLASDLGRLFPWRKPHKQYRKWWIIHFEADGIRHFVPRGFSYSDIRVVGQ